MALNNKERWEKSEAVKEKIKKLVVTGLTSQEIAEKIGKSKSTVDFYILSMMKETNSANRVQLAVKIATDGGN